MTNVVPIFVSPEGAEEAARQSVELMRVLNGSVSKIPSVSVLSDVVLKGTLSFIGVVTSGPKAPELTAEEDAQLNMLALILMGMHIGRYTVDLPTFKFLDGHEQFKPATDEEISEVMRQGEELAQQISDRVRSQLS